MRVHVGDTKLVPLLLAYFEEQADCVATQVGEAEIEVSLLGSFRRDVHDAAVDSLVAGFRLMHGELHEAPAPNGK